MKTCINGATTKPRSLGEDLDAAAAAGFEGVEIWYPKLVDFLEHHRFSELKSRLDESGLEVAALCPLFFPTFSQDAQKRDALVKAAELAEELGCSTLLVCPEASPESIAKEVALQRTADEAERCIEAIADANVRLAIEPLGMHPVIPGPHEAMQVLEEVGNPSLGLMMDVFHYFKSGVSLDEIASIPVQDLLIVHVNDCEDRPLHELKDAHRLYPTRGVIPAVEMIAVVRENGYNGYLSVEIFRPEYWDQPAGEVSRQAKMHLDKLIAQIGAGREAV